MKVKTELKQEYDAYMKSKEWKAFREKVIEERKHCECCKSKRILQVHHVTYENFRNESMDDVLLLCSRCHTYVHQGKIAIIELNQEEYEAFLKIKHIIFSNFSYVYGYVLRIVRYH